MIFSLEHGYLMNILENPIFSPDSYPVEQSIACSGCKDVFSEEVILENEIRRYSIKYCKGCTAVSIFKHVEDGIFNKHEGILVFYAHLHGRPFTFLEVFQTLEIKILEAQEQKNVGK